MWWVSAPDWALRSPRDYPAQVGRYLQRPRPRARGSGEGPAPPRPASARDLGTASLGGWTGCCSPRGLGDPVGSFVRAVGNVLRTNLCAAAARAGANDGPGVGMRCDGRNRGSGRRRVRRHNTTGRLATRGRRWTFRGYFLCPHFARARSGCRDEAPRPPCPSFPGRHSSHRLPARENRRVPERLCP